MAKLKIDGNDLELAPESSGSNGYTQVQNFLNMSPEDIDPLIAALQQAKSKL